MPPEADDAGRPPSDSRRPSSFRSGAGSSHGSGSAPVSRQGSFSRSGSFSKSGNYAPLAVLPSAQVEAKPIARRRARSIDSMVTLPPHAEEGSGSGPGPEHGPCTARVLTYNVKGLPPYRYNLKDVLLAELDPALASASAFADPGAWREVAREGPDLLCVGLQEIVPLKVTNVVNAGDASRQGDLWEYSLDLAVSELTIGGEKYAKIGSRQMVGLLMALYVKERVAGQLSGVQTGAVPTGFGGMFKNKGAVCLRFDLHESSFCFVCAHLAPHDKNVAIRNKEYFEILQRTQFPAAPGILAHEFVVFFGDLNYRVVGEAGPVGRQALAGDLAPLLAADQLAAARASAAAFHHFREAAIRFGPTFKYEVGGADFCPESKKRTPSWTDRVLFAGPGPLAECLWYGSFPRFVASDHKPVAALLRFHVRGAGRAEAAPGAPALALGPAAPSARASLSEHPASASAFAPPAASEGAGGPRRAPRAPLFRSSTQPEMNLASVFSPSQLPSPDSSQLPLEPSGRIASSGGFAFSAAPAQRWGAPAPLSPPLRTNASESVTPPPEAGGLELEQEAPWWSRLVPCCLRVEEPRPPRRAMTPRAAAAAAGGQLLDEGHAPWGIPLNAPAPPPPAAFSYGVPSANPFGGYRFPSPQPPEPSEPLDPSRRRSSSFRV